MDFYELKPLIIILLLGLMVAIIFAMVTYYKTYKMYKEVDVDSRFCIGLFNIIIDEFASNDVDRVSMRDSYIEDGIKRIFVNYVWFFILTMAIFIIGSTKYAVIPVFIYGLIHLPNYTKKITAMRNAKNNMQKMYLAPVRLDDDEQKMYNLISIHKKHVIRTFLYQLLLLSLMFAMYAFRPI